MGETKSMHLGDVLGDVLARLKAAQTKLNDDPRLKSVGAKFPPADLQEFREALCAGLSLFPPITEVSLRAEFVKTIYDLVLWLVVDRVPPILRRELDAARKELQQYGPRIGELYNFGMDEATQEKISSAASQSAAAWKGVFLALAKAEFADANLAVLEATKVLLAQTSAYDEEGSDELALAIAQRNVAQSRQRRQNAIVSLQLSQQMQPDDPDSVPPGGTGDN